MLSALALAIQVLESLLTLAPLGLQVASLVQSTVATLKQMQAQNRDPLPSEWEAIHIQIDALRAALDTPEGIPLGTEGLLAQHANASLGASSLDQPAPFVEPFPGEHPSFVAPAPARSSDTLFPHKDFKP